MSIQHTRALGIILSFGTLVTLAHAGPDWIEDGDAGSMIGDAQNTTSIGFLQTIAGTLGTVDQEDVYRINVEDADSISNPVTFGFHGINTFDAALWLFDSTGLGVLGNDDDPILGGPNASLTTPSTDGVTLLLAPGTYYLAITESGNVPLSFVPGDAGRGGSYQEIFFFASSTEVSGPDGPGGANPLAAWTGGAGNGGTYGIVITPAPSALGLLSIAGLGVLRRRR